MNNNASAHKPTQAQCERTHALASQCPIRRSQYSIN